ncbi:hypothetical protein MOX02_35610 [Methylobacterium oxalidis]|uniref:Uncharacterized protein n=2 Tax=Methylobacterium oxalidis TaxID=944322 RepID=A0A512J6G6_9HYPH|nr:hypothetical protein MOX02_35610 [Methylobacterium oxalidis]GLS65584.1 hypothetical protein GCM10007888_39660 [Methylobacterium oxalidis]
MISITVRFYRAKYRFGGIRERVPLRGRSLEDLEPQVCAMIKLVVIAVALLATMVIVRASMLDAPARVPVRASAIDIREMTIRSKLPESAPYDAF